METIKPDYRNSSLPNRSSRRYNLLKTTPAKNLRYRNTGCLFCPYTADRGTVNHHLNYYVPVLASKLKSIKRLFVDDFHHVGIVTGARYDKQSAATRAKISMVEWDMPGLTECIVLTEFGKVAVMELRGQNELENHSTRVRIPKAWWERKVAQAVRFLSRSSGFNLNAFIIDTLNEAHGLWYPRYGQLGDSIVGGFTTPKYAKYIPDFRLGKAPAKRPATPSNTYKHSLKPPRALAKKKICVISEFSDDDEPKYFAKNTPTATGDYDTSCGAMYLHRHWQIEDDENFIDKKVIMKKQYEIEKERDVGIHDPGLIMKLKTEGNGAYRE